MTHFFRARLAASLLFFLPLIGSAATVTVNVSSPLAVMPDQGIGVNTATYENALCDGTQTVITQRVAAAGITAFRYPGGSYADVWNWAQNTYNPGLSVYYNANDTFDNFMKRVVNPVGAHAIITIDYGSDKFGTSGVATNDIAEAAAWVAYANVTNHWGVKYWEIGNEQAGNGFYGTKWETDLHVDKSPTAYGSNVVKFVAAMKGVDPTIKVGAAIVQPGVWPDAFESPPLPYDRSVLTNCGSVIDFVILHWYPVQPGDSASQVFSYPTTIPAYVQSVRTALTNYCGAVRAGQIGIAITETDCNTNTAAVSALYMPDMYLTWFENGVFTVTWQEMHGYSPVNSDYMWLDYPASPWTNQQPCAPLYGAWMTHLLANVGDSLVSATSSSSTLRVHASSRADGKVGIMFINQNSSSSQPANVTVSGVNLAGTGTWYQFGLTNFAHLPSDPTPTYPVSTNPVSGLGNSFSVSIPAYTIVDLVIPTIPVLPTTTTVALTSGSNPSTYGTGLTFTATVRTNGVAVGSISGESVGFYDGTTLLGSATLNSSGQASISTTTTQFAAGAHSIIAGYSGDSNFTGSTNSPGLAQTVNALPVVLTGTRPYDASTAAPAAILSVANPAGSDSVAVASGSGTLVSPSVGLESIASFGDLALGGASATNYTLALATGTVNITAVPVTISSGISANDKTFDGTTLAGLNSNNVVLAGIVPSDSANAVLLTNGYIALFATVNPGTGIPVTVTNLTLTGSAAANYSLQQPAGLTANILPPTIPTFLKPAISLGPGGWQLLFSGPLGQSYSILSSTDLTVPLNSWNTLASGTFGSDPITVADSATNDLARFYLIVTP